MPSKASIRSMVSNHIPNMTDLEASSSYIPLQERDQWSDLSPIEQDDGPTPLVPIMYSEECEFSFLPLDLGSKLIDRPRCYGPLSSFISSWREIRTRA